MPRHVVLLMDKRTREAPGVDFDTDGSTTWQLVASMNSHRVRPQSLLVRLGALVEQGRKDLERRRWVARSLASRALRARLAIESGTVPEHDRVDPSNRTGRT